jgi:3-mercaptopyruvate sulfurtransferase SseA
MAGELEKMGFTNIYVLEGGFRAWQGKEFPLVPKEWKPRRADAGTSFPANPRRVIG